MRHPDCLLSMRWGLAAQAQDTGRSGLSVVFPLNLEPATSVSGDDNADAQQDLTQDVVRVRNTRA